MHAPRDPAPARAEIHVPIAPTPGFLMRLQLLAASVRQNAGALADSPITAWVTRDVEPFDLDAAAPWSERLGVTWRWIDQEDHDRWGMYGTALLRLRHEFTAPYVLLLDADTVCVAPLDDLPSLSGDGIAGVIAHVSPAALRERWRDGVVRAGADYWHDLHEQAGLAAATMGSEHTGWGVLDADPERRACPHYYNLGMIAGSADAMRRIGAVIMEELDAVDRSVETWCRCQLALTLAIARTGMDAVDLPLRWNLPNDPDICARWPLDTADVRILHYLREDEVHRDRDLGSTEGVAALSARTGLHPVNQLLQRVVGDLGAALDEARVAGHR